MNNEGDQQSIFNTQPGLYELFIDGASRGNPGPSGIGICMVQEGKKVIEKGCFIGEHTNNEAEYIALIFGLYIAKQFCKALSSLVVKADSQLLVRQMQGSYRIKEPRLQRLSDRAHHLCGEFGDVSISFTHILREKNGVADQLANIGIDKKYSLPLKFLHYLHTYGVDV